jgi:hypothetical protein
MNFSRKIFFILLFSSSISILLFLSFNGYWSLTHGPLYFFIGDYIAAKHQLGSSIFVIDNNNIYTFQIGIALLHALSIKLLKGYWYLLYIIIISSVWLMTTIKIHKKLAHFKLSKLDISLILLVIFFQPYNLNQIANFSNEALYLPLLIYFFFFQVDIYENGLKIIFKKKIKTLLYLTFLFFGFFFRLHHYIFLITIILTCFVNRKKSNIYYYLIIFFLILIFNVIILLNTKLNVSVGTIKLFLDVIIDKYFGNLQAPITSKNFLEKNILISVKNSLSNLSSLIVADKFIKNSYLSIFVSIIFALTVFIPIFQNLKNNKIFAIQAFIFLVLSTLFIFILPIFEGSYLLPSSFITIIFSYIFFKENLKKYFYLIFFFLSFLYVTFIGLVFSETLKIRNIEIYKYRKYVQDVKKLTTTISNKKESSLVYFSENKLDDSPEIIRWYLDFPICNYELSVDDCKKKRGISSLKNIYIIINGNNKEIQRDIKFDRFKYKKNNIGLVHYFLLNEK